MLLANRKTRANVDAMRRAAKQLGVEAPKARGAKPDAELLGALRLEIGARLQQLGEDDHLKCTACGEVATSDTEFCPFCGDEGSANEDEAEATGVTLDEPEPVDVDEPDDEADEDDEPEDEEADDADADEGDSDEEADDGESDDAEEVVDDAVEESVGISPKGSKVARNIDGAIKGMERELNEAVGKICELKRDVVGLSYDIGLLCREIRDKQLFKARGYSSFKDFAEEELPFRRESALHLIKIVESYSRDDYTELGYAKLRVIASVSDEAVKEELITAAREGAPVRELSERASRETGAKPPAPVSGKQKPPKAEKGERITLLGRVGSKKQIVQFHNSASGEILPNAGIFQKKGFTPNAYAELEIASGVFVRIGLRLGADYQLEGLTVRFVRATDG